MFCYINELIKTGSLFWFCALSGSGIFLVHFLITLFALGIDDSFDPDNLISENAHEVSHSSSDIKKFKWLSFQTIAGFLMMFGWTAITCQKQFNLKDAYTLGIAFTVGILAALAVRSIFRLAKKLKSPGTLYKIQDAIGKEAYIYQSIPKGGVGKICINLQGFTHEIHAVSTHTEDLPSFTSVKVIEKKDDDTLVVIPL